VFAIRTAAGRLLRVAGVVASLATLYFAYNYWTNLPRSHVNVYDAFDGPALSNLWETSRFVPGAVTMQSQFVRAGRGAAKIVLKSRDVFEAGIKGSKDTERAELLEARRYVSREDVLYEYSFSQYFPADFPIVPVRLVIAQWKQDCNGHEPCSDDSPVVALRYIGGSLRITRQEGRHQITLFETAADIRGRWSDFRFQIRFTPTDSGVIRAWIDNNQVVDYRGATAYPENAATGYAKPSHFYFKMGLYRDLMEAPMTLYIDEYRKRDLSP
jgi:hypothetical protein